LSTLYVIDGPIKGESFTLQKETTTVGRSSENDLCLPDIGVSRHHAMLIKKGERLFVVDLKSSKGVLIDGEKIEPEVEVEVPKGGTLLIGNTMLSLKPEPIDMEELTSEKEGPRNYTRSLELLLKVSNILVQSLDIDELLNEVIDQIFTLLKRIDRGAILLLDKETGELREKVSRTRAERSGGYLPKINYSRTVVNRAIKGGKPIIMSDTRRADKAELSDSMEQMHILSVMCVPLKYTGEVQGIIYVDSIRLPEGFRKDDLQLLTGLSNTAAIAIENARLYSGLEELVAQRTKQLEMAKNRLKESESRFRAVFENMSSGVAILEPKDNGEDFIIKDINKVGEKIDRIKKENVIGESALTVFPRLEDFGLFNILKRVQKTGVPEAHPDMLYKYNGITSWRNNYVYKLPNGEIVFIYEDVTTQKQAIENQKRLQKKLSHAQKMESLGMLAGGVAHNFRNILQAIMGNSQFLQMVYAQDKQIQDIAGIINESVRKGSDFIDSLLKFSRQDVKGEKFAVNLKDVLDEVNKIISNTFDKRIKIITDIEESLPILGDHVSLSQVFINLCNNSRDSMPSGGELKIEAKKNKKGVTVTISDTGIGMDTETIKNIFDPFYTTKDVGEGTGLGLSIAHGIVEEHNGTISVCSQPGEGTTFTVAFPIAEEPRQIKPESSPRISHGKGEKVLLVDDEEVVLESVGNMLKSIGYHVDSVDSGPQAVEHYKKNHPDLILLDWKMPTMDGVTCAEKIFEYDPKAKIVMISGYQETDTNRIDADLKNLFKGFIVKPCALEELNKIISKALNA